MGSTDKQGRGGERQFHGIELLRFLCALAIVVWHYQHFFMVGDGAYAPSFSREAQPFYPALFVAYNWGSYAVEIFWTLSGFIFFWKYAEPIFEKRTLSRDFFVFRFSRLYPLHFITLLAVVILQGVYVSSHGEPFVYAYNDARHFLLNLVLASQWGFQKGFSFNGPIWSISIEVVAYAVFFVVARRIRFTGTILVAAIAGLFVAKMALPWVREILVCLLYFFIGGAIHLFSARPGARLLRTSVLSGALAALLLYVNWATGGKAGSFAIISVAVALLFAFLSLGDMVRGDTTRGLFALLGSLTYSSYLLHFPLQLGAVILTDRLGLGRDIYFHPGALAAFAACTFLAAFFSFHLIERPAQQWLRSKLGRKRPGGQLQGATVPVEADSQAGAI